VIFGVSVRKAVTAVLLVSLAGCSRPLTAPEESFANAFFGPTLDTSQVRVAQGLGITPLYETVPASITRVKGTEKACVRTPQPRGAQPPQAFAVRNRILIGSELYSSDMVLVWPRGLRLPHAFLFAHELTHVWQWQNRATTGYTPLRAVAESLHLADPYYAAPGEADFHAYGYEQQAALVADFVCFTLSNPSHPRREELRAILAPVFPLAPFEATLAR